MRPVVQGETGIVRPTLRLDRRAFVSGGAALAASAAMPAAALWDDAPTALFLCDRRCALQLPASDRHRDIIWFNGDVTPIWSGMLRPLWRSGEARVVGVTQAPALFCLEQLARGMRHRVIARQALPGTDAIRWVIAPVSSRGLA
jgi:hypothetical protein